MFKYFRPSTRVHQTWIQSTTKYRCWFRIAFTRHLYQAQNVDELKRCLTAVCADIKHSVIDKAVDEWQCVRCQGMTHWTLPLVNIWLFSPIFNFYTCRINSVVPRAPAVRNLGARAPASSMAPAPIATTKQLLIITKRTLCAFSHEIRKLPSPCCKVRTFTQF